jgi:hypothetical protein
LLLKIDFKNSYKSGIVPIGLLVAFSDDLVPGTLADINIRPSGHGPGVDGKGRWYFYYQAKGHK